MTKTLVLVRPRGDRPAVRALLGQEDGNVLVCKPEHVAAIETGELPSPAVALRSSDVFAYDERAAKAADAGKPVDWSRLRRALD